MIYFIQAEKAKRIKIGESDEPVKRREQLQTGSSERLILLAVIAGGQKKESELHKRFDAYKLHGEWFEYSDEIDEYLKGLMYDDGRRIEQCRVCGMLITPNMPESDIKLHSDEHLAIRKGGYPYQMREQMKKIGWAVLGSKGETITISKSYTTKEDAKRLIAYAWWARARKNGLPDKAFEDYILDHLDYLDTKESGDSDKHKIIDQLIKDRWQEFG